MWFFFSNEITCKRLSFIREPVNLNIYPFVFAHITWKSMPELKIKRKECFFCVGRWYLCKRLDMWVEEPG